MSYVQVLESITDQFVDLLLIVLVVEARVREIRKCTQVLEDLVISVISVSLISLLDSTVSDIL